MFEFVVFYGVFALLGMSRGIKKERFLFFSFLVFTLMAALRHYSIGNDTLAYERLYEQIATYGTLLETSRFEIGFVKFNQLLSSISASPQFLIIVTSLIVFITFYLEIRDNSSNYLISVLLFLSCGLFRFSLSAIRQCLALCILIFAIHYLKKNKYVVCAGLCVAAFFFHKSSIVASLLILASSINWNKYVYRLIPFISLGISLFAKSFLFGIIADFGDYGRYLTGIYSGGTRTATLFIIAMEVISIIVISIPRESDSRNEFYTKLSYCRLGLLIASINLNAIDRIADYFIIFEIIALSNALDKYEGNNERILKFSICAMYFLYTLVWGIFRPETQMVWPYHTFFFAG